jgi:hypothetical protein
MLQEPTRPPATTATLLPPRNATAWHGLRPSPSTGRLGESPAPLLCPTTSPHLEDALLIGASAWEPPASVHSRATMSAWCTVASRGAPRIVRWAWAPWAILDSAPSRLRLAMGQKRPEHCFLFFLLSDFLFKSSHKFLYTSKIHRKWIMAQKNTR